jgi:hypothetical protein
MIVSQFAGMAAVMLWAGILPFVASWMLDGIVQLFRNNGLKLLLMALCFTGLVAVAGYFAQQYGLSASSVPPESTATMNTMAQTVLKFTIPLALFAFAARTIKLLINSR